MNSGDVQDRIASALATFTLIADLTSVSRYIHVVVVGPYEDVYVPHNLQHIQRFRIMTMTGQVHLGHAEPVLLIGQIAHLWGSRMGGGNVNTQHSPSGNMGSKRNSNSSVC